MGGKRNRAARIRQAKLEEEQGHLQKDYESVLVRIANSGYSGLEKELETLNETLERLAGGRGALAADVGTAERMERVGCDTRTRRSGILTVS